MKNSRSGFTLIEVLIATSLFAYAILAIVGLQGSSQRSIVQSERMFHATLLAQKLMTDMELKYQKELNTNGLENSVAEESGQFEEPWAQFSWKAGLRESSVELSPSVMEKYMIQMGMDPENAAAQVEEQALVLTNVNKAIKENYGELFVSVSWEFFGAMYSVPLLTHIIPAKPKITLTTTIDR